MLQDVFSKMFKYQRKLISRPFNALSSFISTYCWQPDYMGFVNGVKDFNSITWADPEGGTGGLDSPLELPDY